MRPTSERDTALVPETRCSPENSPRSLLRNSLPSQDRKLSNVPCCTAVDSHVTKESDNRMKEKKERKKGVGNRYLRVLLTSKRQAGSKLVASSETTRFIAPFVIRSTLVNLTSLAQLYRCCCCCVACRSYSKVQHVCLRRLYARCYT